MAEDYSIDKAITLFQDKKHRERIFHKNTFKDRYFPVDYLGLLNACFGPKYSAIKNELDMDLTKDDEINLLIACFNAWKNGHIYNQTIEFKQKRNNDILFQQGDQWYQDGLVGKC